MKNTLLILATLASAANAANLQNIRWSSFDTGSASASSAAATFTGGWATSGNSFDVTSDAVYSTTSFNNRVEDLDLVSGAGDATLADVNMLQVYAPFTPGGWEITFNNFSSGVLDGDDRILFGNLTNSSHAAMKLTASFDGVAVDTSGWTLSSQYEFPLFGDDGWDLTWDAASGSLTTPYLEDQSTTSIRESTIGILTPDNAFDSITYTYTPTDNGNTGGDALKFSFGQAVPEPSSAALLALGAIGFLIHRKR